MTKTGRNIVKNIAALFVVAIFSLSTPAVAGEYDSALKGVKGIEAVFEVSQGSPKVSNLVFWAIKNVYEDMTVKALPEKAKLVIVFHGPAVKLISSEMSSFKEEEKAEIEKFQETLKGMKADGVKMEVCLYAAKVMGVAEETILPEIDRVGNGFISVIGYQEQGYAVVRVP